MGYHRHGHAVPGQLLHNLQHLSHHFGVQGGGGLVKQHDVRLHAQGPGDGHPLLLSAGKLMGKGRRLVLQSHPLQHAQRLGLRLLFAHLFQIHRGQHQVLQHVHVVEQVEMLKHHADPLPELIDVQLRILQVAAVHDDLPAAALLQSVHAPQEGGFSAAGGADDDHHFPLHDLRGNVFQHLQVLKALFQVLHVNLHPALRHASASSPDTWRQTAAPGSQSGTSARRWPRSGRT